MGVRYIFEQLPSTGIVSLNEDDTVAVTSGTAKDVTVIFVGIESIMVTIGAKTVNFGLTFGDVARAGRVIFPDDSLLYVGTPMADGKNFETRDHGAVYAGDGADGFVTVGGDWLMQGNQGDDRLLFSGGSNTVYGGQGNDTIDLVWSSTNAGRNFAQGNRGDDIIKGGGRADTLLGGQGNDVIDGRGDADYINGNLGDDNLTGSGTLLGEGGSDIIFGGTEAANTLMGGDGDDVIIAESVTVGGAIRGAVNLITGDDGNDFLRSKSPQRDTLEGGAGNDTLDSANDEAAGGDLLLGGDGDDVIFAQSGNDEANGNAGSDSLSGLEGDDTLVGGSGTDTLSGGAGADRFRFDSPSPELTFAAADRVIDWQAQDRIQVRAPVGSAYAEATANDFASALSTAQAQIGAGTAEVVAVQVGGDVILFIDGSPANAINAVAVLTQRTLADISTDNFL